MNQEDISLQPIFLTVTGDTRVLEDLTRGGMNGEGLRDAVGELPFNAVYDFMRKSAMRLCGEGRGAEAVERIKGFDDAITRGGEEIGKLHDVHAAALQTVAAVRIHMGDLDGALESAAGALSLLAQQPRRKDEAFLEVLASLLYDIAMIHNSRGQYKQAEREIEKSAKLFERLTRHSSERYGAAHLLAVNACQVICRSRKRQAELLAGYEAEAMGYLKQMNEGMEDAARRLVDTIAAEGRTLVKMSRQREAIAFFMRALKLLTKIEPEFGVRHLELSVDLGEALLAVKGTRDKGIHLLNTMLYKASRLSADGVHRRIVDVLLNARNSAMDIFGFWHKVFPR